ncbi:hypothetical protein H257_16606 [Aphanomyces astaci]|uniref:Crinkler effector protein N-terminal domain-containing protein n=1 Tax=Aphanomyces astaci TaxID=112090 RepID=W4FJW5_APHAT|nr:hypothetical protein H257_16606 [Aphanomyces astaci]ETV67028.1 hypothetical protein H257_16606 [Aphanomyces astaci]|eukprot:XP_009843397.1 hypothetical protein H257_16606 [Aphanomyces astaci]
MKLFTCSDIGDGGVFIIDIDDQQKVGHLKDAIKAKNTSKVTCDASDLTLYLAQKHGEWLKVDLIGRR